MDGAMDGISLRIAGWRNRARQLRNTASTLAAGDTRSILERMADDYDGMVKRALTAIADRKD
jgi:hypothetical protein